MAMPTKPAPPLGALCHAGVAEARRSSLRELLFATPKLLELVGRNLPSRPDLLGELAELVELEEHQLALALLPHALPALVTVQGGLEALAQKVGGIVQGQWLAVPAIQLGRCLASAGQRLSRLSLLFKALQKP